MADLSKVRIAVAQTEVVQGSAKANGEIRDAAVERALQAGADVLFMPAADAGAFQVVPLNDSRLDVAGDLYLLEACGEVYRIGSGAAVPGCDLCVRVDAQPWHLKRPERQRSAAAAQQGKPEIVLAPVGMRNAGQVVTLYDGGTCVFGADGRAVCRLEDAFEGDFALVQFGSANKVAEPCSGKLLAALTSGIRLFDQRVLGGALPWVIGLSGGLDSSVVAALLARSLGTERVHAFGLSTRYNSQTTKDNARREAEALGISYRQGQITGLVDAMGLLARECGFGADALQGLVLENVQARTRGQALSTFAALLGGVVANNGNRVECALGYATLYGDAIGALAPIADLTKVQLFGVAEALNAASGEDVVPRNLLPRETPEGYEWETMPSAELATGQKDPMKWFYHDWLVSELLDDPEQGPCGIIERYLDGSLLEEPLGKWLRFYGLDEPAAFAQDLEWVLRNMRRNVFKRVQAPPALRLASAATLAGTPEWQGPFEASERYRALREKLIG